MRALLLTAVLYAVGLVSASAGDEAATLPPLPTARYGAAMVALDGRVYVIGGYASGGVALNAVEIYDPRTNAWSRGSPLPVPSAWLAAAPLDDKLYVTGGGDAHSFTDAVYTYEPRLDQWRIGPPLPTPINAHAAAAFGNRLYVIGGGENGAGTYRSVYVLDPLSEHWSRGPVLRVPRHTPAAAAVSGRLWVIGGDAKSPRATVESLASGGKAWALKGHGLPSRTSALAAAAVTTPAGLGVFVAGGGTDVDGRFQALDLAGWLDSAGSWRAVPAMPTARSGLAAAAIGSVFYAAGGSPGSNRALDVFEAFDTRTGRWRTSAGGARAPAPAVAAPRIASFDDDVAAPPAPGAARRADDYALVIGLDDYRSIASAAFGQRDAESFARYATAKLGVPEENVITLLGERATKTDLVKYLEEWLPRNVDEKSRVYVYYSGHGAPDPENGTSYLVPWDGDPQFLQSTGYPLPRLYEKLQALRAKKVVVFIDACFSGAGGRSVIATNLRPLVHVVDVRLPKTGKVTVLSASGASQVAGGFDAKKHGLFTYYLLKGLGGEATAKNHLDVSDLYKYVRTGVRKQAHRDNREQDPQLQTSEPGLRLY
jgi:hypothetical protein